MWAFRWVADTSTLEVSYFKVRLGTIDEYTAIYGFYGPVDFYFRASFYFAITELWEEPGVTGRD